MGIYDPTLPAPRLISAENIGPYPGEPDLIQVRLTFEDTAEDEYLTSAYFQGENPPATQNITGTPDASGVMAAEVVIGQWVDNVQLRYLWTTNFSDPSKNVWGPFGNNVAITVAAAPVPGGGSSGSSGKGHGKGGKKG